MKSAIGGDISITFGGDTYHINDCKNINVTQECDVISETSYDYPCAQHCYGKPTISGSFEALISDHLFLKLAEAIYKGVAMDIEIQLLASTRFTGGFNTTIYFSGVYFESLPLIGAQFQAGSAYESVTLEFKANAYRISEGGFVSDVLGSDTMTGINTIDSALSGVKGLISTVGRFI